MASSDLQPSGLGTASAGTASTATPEAERTGAPLASPYVFLSYASRDRRKALLIAERLRAVGVRVWIDQESIAGARKWTAEIVRGIRGCSAFLLLCSPTSLGSPNVHQELQLAWDARRPLLPVLLEKTDYPEEVEYMLAGRQWVEALDRPEAEWLPKILEALDHLEVPVLDGGRGSPYGLEKLLRQLRRHVVLAATALGLLVATAAGVWYTVLRHPQAAAAMTGDLNVAVAPFTGADSTGHLTQSPDADRLSQSVYEALVQELKPSLATSSSAGGGFDIQVASPARAGRVVGDTAEARARAAFTLAKQMNADVILYGTLRRESDATTFTPEFYISPRKMASAEELVGQYELGTKISVLGALDNVDTRQDLREQLLGRAKALSQFALGLGYYANYKYTDALTHFQAAEKIRGWDDHDGREVLYLFLGNAELRLDDLSAARADFERALQLNPGYARAQIAAASALFEASTHSGRCESGQVDADGVRAAIRGYEGAVVAQVQPPQADVKTKSAFGTGVAYLCLSSAQIEDRWSDAKLQFQAVLQEFESGNGRIRDLAAEAAADLGLIGLPSVGEADAGQKYLAAANDFRRAVQLARQPGRQAVFNLNLTHIYLRLHDCTQAKAAQTSADAAHRRASRLDSAYDELHQAIQIEFSSAQC